MEKSANITTVSKIPTFGMSAAGSLLKPPSLTKRKIEKEEVVCFRNIYADIFCDNFEISVQQQQNSYLYYGFDNMVVVC
jgi:hypothetical protein